MPGYHVHQTGYNIRRDTKALARSFLRHKAWPRVYKELSQGATTHSTQSWRNFHNKNKAKVQQQLEKQKTRLQQRREDRSPHSSSDEDESVPPPPKATSAAGIPARGKPGAKRRPAPNVNDFGTSSSEEESDAEKAEEDEEEKDELASSASPHVSRDKGKGKQRAEPEADVEPRSKRFPVEKASAAKRRKVSKPAREPSVASDSPFQAFEAAAESPLRGFLPSDEAADDLSLQSFDMEFDYDRPLPGFVGQKSPSRPRTPTKKADAQRAAGPSSRRAEQPNSDDVLVFHDNGDVSLKTVDAQVTVATDVSGNKVFQVTAIREMAGSPLRGSGSPSISSPAKQRALAPRVSTSSALPPRTKRTEPEPTDSSDGESEDGEATQALKRRFGNEATSRRASDASNSSDLVRDQFVPAKRTRKSPLKEITSSQEHDASESEEEASPIKAPVPAQRPAQPSPRRLRSRGPTSSIEPAVEAAATPTIGIVEEEEQASPATAKKASKATAVRPITLSQADLRACYAVARHAEANGTLKSDAFHAFFACCGELRVMSALQVPPEKRTAAQNRVIEQGYWDATDDEIVKKGSAEAQKEVEARRGKGSVAFRRQYLELLGHGSTEHF